MIFKNFSESEFRNAWVMEYETLRLYIRRSPPSMKHRWGDFQLASMINEKPGTGLLTRFLDTWEPKYQFYIENILNPRLFEYFKRRGYTILEEKEPQCMLGPLPKEKNYG
jgi:hypothetical protein